MEVVALVSGGKDSCMAMLECVRYGHRIVALANLLPPPSSPSGTKHSFFWTNIYLWIIICNYFINEDEFIHKKRSSCIWLHGLLCWRFTYVVCTRRDGQLHVSDGRPHGARVLRAVHGTATFPSHHQVLHCWALDHVVDIRWSLHSSWRTQGQGTQPRSAIREDAGRWGWESLWTAWGSEKKVNLPHCLCLVCSLVVITNLIDVSDSLDYKLLLQEQSSPTTSACVLKMCTLFQAPAILSINFTDFSVEIGLVVSALGLFHLPTSGNETKKNFYMRWLKYQ